MNAMFKKIMFILVSCIALWWLFGPTTLQDQLYASIQENCKNKKKCVVRLHELTSFKWDKAYFFSHESAFDVDISKIIKEPLNIQWGVDTLVIFTLKGKVIEKELFPVIDDSYYDIRFPPLFQIFPSKSVDINFLLNKSDLIMLNYSGNIDDFVDLIGIEYYEMTPQNDQLYAGCATLDLPAAAGSKVEEKQCGFSFTNLNQVVLFNPKTHKQ
ncbi:unnamed protein product [Commensalibacter communis]|nr:unnamed protein product [Commensalibacter communis]